MKQGDAVTIQIETFSHMFDAFNGSRAVIEEVYQKSNSVKVRVGKQHQKHGVVLTLNQHEVKRN